MFTALLLFIAALFVVVVALQRRRAALLQLLYLLRFPLVFGLALLALPLLAVWIAPAMLKNLFVVGTPWEIALVEITALYAAWVVMYTFFLLLRSIFNTNPDLAEAAAASWWGRPRPAVMRWRALLFAGLMLPTLGAVLWLSRALGPVRLGVGSVATAILGVGLWWLMSRLQTPAYTFFRRVRTRLGRIWQQRMPPAVQSRVARSMPADVLTAYQDEPDDIFRHDAALAFMGITLILYLAGYVLFLPGGWLGGPRLPALVFILVLLILLAWVFPGMAFLLDRYRIPTALIVLALSFGAFTLTNADHYFTVVPLAELAAVPAPQNARAAPAVQPLDPKGVMDAWQAEQTTRVPVIVLASGGGARAALWTAQVLTGLQQKFGPDFARSIVLVSAVSGGSNGAMYYVDAYHDGGPPADTQLPAIVDAAAYPSLTPLTWGLVYPDLWRPLWGLPLLRRIRYMDRGWALENLWEHQLAKIAAAGPGQDPAPHVPRTLGDWQAGVQAGWRPAAIFNSTVVQTGERFLFASFDVPCDWQTRSFHRSFPGYDVPVVTAVRMSATFPYVTPNAQADIRAAAPAGHAHPCPADTPGGLPPDGPLHLADGGYFDNDGVVSGLEWLESVWLAPDRETRDPGLAADRVLIVQIVADPVNEPPPAPDPDAPLRPQSRIAPTGTGWRIAVAGPLITLLNVRGATQVERGQTEIRRFVDLYAAKGIQILHCVFDLRAQGESVLSWQLSPEEETSVRRAWQTDLAQEGDRPDGRFGQIEAFLTGGTVAACARPPTH